MHPVVSVIVPIFKVEAFIKKCVQQLLQQSLDNIELLFVDDASPDNSLLILKEELSLYKGQKTFKIIQHRQNLGLPAARNTGLKEASGDFVFHCDSDDWLDKNALESLVTCAEQQHADIVFCDWYLSYRAKERYMSQYVDGVDLTKPTEVVRAILSGKLKYNVWNKLVRRKLYTDHNIWFPAGYGMGEDMTMIQLFAFAKRTAYLPQALYHYVQLNTGAFTKTVSQKHLEQIKYNVETLLNFVEKFWKGQFNQELHFFKLNVKLPFLISTDIQSYERWLLWYPESNAYIDRNPLFSKRTKLLQKWALQKNFRLLQCYNFLIYTVIYRMLYR
ncbi:glycosyltransferase family 2 protein [Sphingobacterium sp. Mn56C]|uniref:glycosyltransferase family 2 protein n=1 Tax=Sphingobacterium sp. Mn56C TaxID=3395261 RepID=UPI003BBE4316